MKNFMITAGTIMIISCHTACRTNKLGMRQENHSALFEQTEIRNLEQENREKSRLLAITDSSGQEYRITIFPTDSFQFSPERGFSGKASKIELSGSIHRSRQIHDSTDFRILGIRESRTTQVMKQDVKELNRAKSTEKIRLVWWAAALALIAVLVLGWLKLRRY